MKIRKTFFYCLFLILFQCNGGKITNPKIVSKVKNPSTNDFYHFALGKIWYIAKVDSFSEDSIYFKYLRHDKGSTINSGYNYGNYLMEHNSILTSGISKEDILRSPYRKSSNAEDYGRVIFPTVNDNKGLNLFKINRVENIENINVSVKDSIVENKIINKFNKFKSINNINTQLSMMDSSSIPYLKSIIENAKSKSILDFKRYLINSEYSTLEYEIAMLTKYIFLNSPEIQSLNNEKQFKLFLPFFAIFSSSIFSYVNNNNNFKIESVFLADKDYAIAVCNATANKVKSLGSQIPISKIKFEIKFYLENGEWKMNLPSTYSYVEDQIRILTDQEVRKNGGYSIKYEYKEGIGEKKYRGLVRENIYKAKLKVEIDEELKY